MSERFVDVVEDEIAEEKAGALGRAGRRLEHALELFRDYKPTGEPGADTRREQLLWDLAACVEAFVAQREACGLRDSGHVLRHYDIPREAIARIGARRPR
jgi:hypothetical protein